MKIILIIVLVIISACSYSNKNITEKQNANLLEKRFTKTQKIVEKEIVLGEATTDIIDQGKNRVINIDIACAKISGIEVLPGKTFSFNETTGKKNESNGYKYAPVLIDGEKSYGIGGGVCQVSTTIYMAVLNAGLEITEHFNHSEPVAYAAEGMDATVVFGVKDLKFRNNTDKKIYIYTWTEQEKVFAKIIEKSIDIQE